LVKVAIYADIIHVLIMLSNKSKIPLDRTDFKKHIEVDIKIEEVKEAVNGGIK